MMTRYDIIIVGDFRFQGGTSSAIAEEIRAQAAAGYSTGLVQLKGPVLRYPHPFHASIRACLDSGLAQLLDPEVQHEAGVVLIHHPSLFTYMPKRPLRLDARHYIQVVHHPLFGGDGEPYFDCATVDRNMRDYFGAEILWAPVGPLVRQQLLQVETPPLIERDWYNILDSQPWHHERTRFNDLRPVIGRHSRPDPLKWPDNRDQTLDVYPGDPPFRVKVLGGGPFLRELLGSYPPNWTVHPFQAKSPESFLREIDFFVYYHHSKWVEAFGRTVIEAMASGAVAILPPSFEPLFGEAALYAEPSEVRNTVLDLHRHWGRFLERSRCGQIAVQEIFGPKTHARRIAELIGKPARSAVSLSATGSATRSQVRPQRVIFMTSNGVGMGHLTRMLAIARRCPAPITPVFLTMSQAYGVVHEQGFAAEYLPFHVYLKCDQAQWNRYLRKELNEFIAFYDASVVVFDGNVPYGGLISTIADNPDVMFLWSRRGMWQPNQGGNIIDRQRHFYGVIEPGDLAAGQDKGLTTQYRGLTRPVAPIRFLDDEEMLERTAARQALGLADERPAVLIQLGSRNNFDYDEVQRVALQKLRQKDVQIVMAEWLISEGELQLDEGIIPVRTFPLAKYYKAFDLAISAVGYNSFHELIFAGVPTIFVPNENPQQDDQLGRAIFADLRGLGRCVRRHDLYRLTTTIDRLLDPGEVSTIIQRCRQLDRTNGAHETATMISELIYTRRADQP